MNRSRGEPSPRLAVGILAVALALPFALIGFFTIVTTRRLGVTIAVGLPLVAGLTMISAGFAMRHQAADTRRHIRACRARSTSRTILLVYFVLVVPTALIFVAGQG